MRERKFLKEIKLTDSKLKYDLEGSEVRIKFVFISKYSFL